MQSIMQKRNMMVLPKLMLAAGCAISPSDSSDTANAIGNVPESVVAMAAPDQDVSTARLRPGDGCYWYEHNGRWCQNNANKSQEWPKPSS